MAKFFSCFLLLPLTFSAVFSQVDSLPGKKLSLSQCIELALKNNPDIKRSAIQTQISRVNYRQSKADLLPRVDGNYSQGMNFGRSIDPYTNSYIDQKNSAALGGFSGSLPLFNGFALYNGIRRNGLNYKAAQMDEQQAKDDLTLNVVLAYLDVLSAEELLSQTIQSREVSQKRLQQVEILNKEGAVDPRSYHDIKAEFSGSQLNYVNASNTLQNAKLNLSQLLNIPYSQTIAVESLNSGVELIASNITPQQVYNDALASLAVVKAADFRTESADADIRIRRANYFPSISLQGGLNSNYSSTAAKDIFINAIEVESPNFVEVNGTRYPVKVQQQNFKSEKIAYTDQFKNNRYSYFNVGLNIPIFNNFRTRNTVSIAKLNKKDAEIQAESVRIKLQQLTEQAYYNMNFSKDAYLALTDQVSSLEESFRTAEVKFNAGAINSVDYLIAKNSLDNARLDLIRSRYNFILRKQIVEYYRGNRSF